MLVPIIGMLSYVWRRPKLTAHEHRALEAYEAAVVPGGTVKTGQIAPLARLRSEGDITEDE